MNLSFKRLKTNEIIIKDNMLGKTIKDNERDSFTNRIGNDLCEFIFEFLPIEDKVKFRTICKRIDWCLQNVIKRQRVLSVEFRVDCRPRYYVSENEWSQKLAKSQQFWIKQLNKYLKTFQNVNDVSIRIVPNIPNGGHLLEAIVDNCKDLKSLRYYCQFEDIENRIISKFCHKFGQSLEVIANFEYDFKYYSIESLVQIFPNLNSIQSLRLTFDDIQDLNTNYKLKKLKNLHIRENCLKTSFDTFVEKYPNLNHLSIFFGSINDSMVYMISKLSHLKNLEKLIITVNNESPLLLVKSLEQIGSKCLKLNSFRIRFSYEKDLSVNLFYKHFHKFSNLKELCIRFESNIESEISFKFLTQFKCLTKLEVRANTITDDSFNEIHKFVPKLEYLTIGSNIELTDKALKWISKLKDLKKFTISENFFTFYVNKLGKTITDEGIICLLENCNHLEYIKIERPVKTTKNTFNKIIEKSVKNPFINFEYELEVIESKGVFNFEKLFLQNQNPLNNLTINRMTKTEIIEWMSETESSVLKCKFY